jgi:hypothetical protein
LWISYFPVKKVQGAPLRAKNFVNKIGQFECQND